jgi:large subunit ribosomal protein L23
MRHIELTPRFSEKAYGMSMNKLNPVVVFTVNKEVNKNEIKRAVEEEYKVTVTDVRITNRKPKAYQRMVSRRSRAITVKINGYKKAYVTLKVGDFIPVFGEQAVDPETSSGNATKTVKSVVKKTDAVKADAKFDSKPVKSSITSKLNSVVKRAGGSRGGDK